MMQSYKSFFQGKKETKSKGTKGGKKEKEKCHGSLFSERQDLRLFTI
jgi:hypothetical protein